MDKAHGRLEIRQIWTSTQLKDYLEFPYAQQVFCIQRDIIYLTTGKQRSEKVYGLTSLPIDKANAQKLLELARGHWSIENRLHWVRDVTFDEDRCRIRKGYGAQNMACLRNLAISVLRMAGARLIPSGLRYCARLGENVIKVLGVQT